MSISILPVSLLATLNRLWNDPFLRKSGVYFVGSMMVAVLNYLYYPVLGRRLALQEFGDVQALLSLFVQIATILGGFTLATVHVSANCDVAGECQALIRILRRYAFYTAAIFIVGLLILAPWVSGSLHFSNVKLLFLLPILVLVNIFYTLQTGYLQGKGGFGSVAIGNLLVAAGRLVFALGLIWLGWQAFGVIAGLVIAYGIALVYVYTRLHEPVSPAVEAFVVSRERLRDELKYVALVVCSSFLVTALYLSDVLVVKRFFPPLAAGVYSGISTVANIAFFVTGPIGAVFLASLKRSDVVEVRRQAFFKAFGLIFLLGGGMVGFFLFSPHFLINVLMGDRYLAYAHLLPWLGGAFFCASLTNLSVSVGMALRRQRLIILAICGISLLVFLSLIRHASLDQIVQNFFLCDLIMAVAAFGCAWPDLCPSSV